MKVARAALFGILGAVAMSVIGLLLRAAGFPLRFELILGTIAGVPEGPEAYAAGLAIHLVIGTLLGVLYGYLFERVLNHGGARTGMLVSVVQAAFVGMIVGLNTHPDVGIYFKHLGLLGIVCWFGLHLMYGAIVGAGYGHVVSERAYGWPVNDR